MPSAIGNKKLTGKSNQPENTNDDILYKQPQEIPNWILAEDSIAEYFRNRDFRVEQQVKVESGIIDLIALWKRSHEKHHFLIECKNHQKFTKADEKSLVHQLYRYLIGYIKTRLPREHNKRRHIIILLGICTNTYRRPFRQIDLNYYLHNQRIETGKKIHAIRCYITSPRNVSKILHSANIPAGLQNKLCE